MIVQGIARQFRRDQKTGLHDLVNDELKLAIYLATASLDPATVTDYDSISAGELSADGYTAGGLDVTQTGVDLDDDLGTTGIDLADVEFGPTTITNPIAGAVLYNVTRSNKIIAIARFTPTARANATFRFIFPPALTGQLFIRSTG